jgi:hypothetical protein
MIEKLNNLKNTFLEQVKEVSSKEELENLEKDFLGKK